MTTMAPLIAAVFLASLLGSLHCAGMCGGFMAFAVGADGRPANRGALLSAYHLGRLATYTLLGALAGGFGAAVDHTGTLAGLQRGAAAVAGAAMVIFGLLTILRVLGVRVMRAPAPEFLRRVLVRGHRVAFDLPPLRRAAVVGLLTTLLPCGWLYTFAISAAGTGSPLWGAATMAVFWLGTLPVMMALGAGIQSLTGVLRERLPLITSVAVVVVGLVTVFQRLNPHGSCHKLPSAAMILPSHEGEGACPRCGP